MYYLYNYCSHESSAKENGVTVMGMHQELDPKPWYHSNVQIFSKELEATSFSVTKTRTPQITERKKDIEKSELSDLICNYHLST